MKFHALPLEGAYLIELEEKHDERGFFARSWCAREFLELGLTIEVVQCNISYNKDRGTLRGMHFQKDPDGERKLVRCTRGSLFDVIIDLRPESKTYKQWYGCELTLDNHTALYIPKGFAHGFLTLENDTEVFYQMYDYFVPKATSGVRWSDPAWGIKWPVQPEIISEHDNCYPDYK